MGCVQGFTESICCKAVVFAEIRCLQSTRLPRDTKSHFIPNMVSATSRCCLPQRSAPPAPPLLGRASHKLNSRERDAGLERIWACWCGQRGAEELYRRPLREFPTPQPPAPVGERSPEHSSSSTDLPTRTACCPKHPMWITGPSFGIFAAISCSAAPSDQQRNLP